MSLTRLTLLAVLLAAPRGVPGAEPVTLDLPDRATTAAAVVTVGDLVRPAGGDPATRAAVAKLDLADVPARSASLTVTRRQVEFRLRLAGIPPDAVRVTGAAAVTVSVAKRTVSADEVVSAAKDALARRLAMPAGDVVIEPVQPVAAQLPEVPAGADVVIAAEPHSRVGGPGCVQMDVTISVQGERRLSLAVALEARAVRPVAVCVRPVAAGTVVTEDAVREERQPVPAGTSPLPASQVVGRKATRALTAGQLVRPTDLEAARQAAAAVVRAQQRVTLVVRAGAITLWTAGEALQEARLGQPIRVLNTDSKQVVVGRVSGPDRVDVEVGGTP